MLKLIDERTNKMIADVFTKMVKPSILYEARILIEYNEDPKDEIEDSSKANVSARVVHAAVSTSAKLSVECAQREDGSVEVRLVIPPEVLADESVLQALAGSFGVKGVSPEGNNIIA